MKREPRVYIAAPWPLLTKARALMEALAKEGVGCTSRWITEYESADLNDASARKDLSDVAGCDVFVALNPVEWAEKGTGGRHVEFGYAVALQLPIILVGRRTNIFHYLSDVLEVDDGRNGWEFLAMNVRERARRSRAS